MGICKIFMQGPLREDLTRITTRSPDKALNKIMRRPLRENFTRISARSSQARTS
jgi:hypothetical protein